MGMVTRSCYLKTRRRWAAKLVKGATLKVHSWSGWPWRAWSARALILRDRQLPAGHEL